jgi:hypothetical protein
MTDYRPHAPGPEAPTGRQRLPRDADVPFEEEIHAAVREERRISAKVLIALLVVGLVIAARLLFF